MYLYIYRYTYIHTYTQAAQQSAHAQKYAYLLDRAMMFPLGFHSRGRSR